MTNDNDKIVHAYTEFFFANEMNFKLTHCLFRVKDPNELLRFYVENFGITNMDNTCFEFHHVKSSTNENLLVNSGIGHVYWKIGITTYDVDYVRQILQSKQIQSDDPVQFEDIGYVCHLKDPHGFIIELLQHDFQQTFINNMNKYGRQPINEHLPLGYPCCFGQITLQTNDIDKTRWFYEDVLEMKLLSIQDVPKYNFTLYFFAWTNENPPKTDLRDVSTNREWLWKRPYTIIEFRYFHYEKRKIPLFKDLHENELGFEGIRIMCNELDLFIDKLKAEKINFEKSNGIYENEIVIRDPNNVPVYVSFKTRDCN